ncbi:Os04g0399600 [Oryza sativa Japonica Group]|uniref:Os04g0399600 protein n=1 Tax=Oryza sativa subsp. japonica TaxID=39947 RepID=A0A0P0W9M1_ORYSJ|nr:Os04g0399600 [Oryza sativa Japonica Group]
MPCLISRQDEDAVAAHQLVFVWAPFLLIHLGGQDTIIGFSLEDNNLWLRHLLNLVVQVVLALYIFWKSAIGPNMNKVELVMSILLFVTGIIKYGERTWALQYGVLRTLAASLPRYALQLRNSFQKSLPICPGCDQDKYIGQLLDNADSGTNDDDDPFPEPLALEILEIELGLVYDYIYTKAVVFQTRRGIALRCISQASFLAAFLLFLVSNIQRHNSINTVITYALFVGGFEIVASLPPLLCGCREEGCGGRIPWGSTNRVTIWRSMMKKRSDQEAGHGNEEWWGARSERLWMQFVGRR